MAPTAPVAKSASLERENQAPPLPPEVWHLIFLQNTNPKHLWTVGRQVCSLWRTEIPKTIARKYLEDPEMTQIHCDCEIALQKSLSCLMGSKLVFSRYEDKKTRAVFKKRPEDEDEEQDHYDFCTENLARAKEEKSRSLNDFFIQGTLYQELCFDCRRESTSGSKRCDLPPYQIRIKWEANDTELPSLEVDFEKAEIT